RRPAAGGAGRLLGPRRRPGGGARAGRDGGRETARAPGPDHHRPPDRAPSGRRPQGAAPMTTTTAAQDRIGTGVVIPLCTPLRSDGGIDSPSLRRHLDHLIDHGVDGVFALGTCGEFGFLTDEQRVEVVRTTVDQVAGRVPVLVGVSDTASERAAAQVRLLMGLGADAAVATAPFFAETGPAEIAAHFRRIKQELGELPLYGYENPPRVNGVSIPVETVLDLAADGTFAGFKDSSGDLDYLGALLAGRDERGLGHFRILSGSETLAAESLRAGADGLVPGLGNVDPA